MLRRLEIGGQQRDADLALVEAVAAERLGLHVLRGVLAESASTRTGMPASNGQTTPRPAGELSAASWSSRSPRPGGGGVPEASLQRRREKRCPAQPWAAPSDRSSGFSPSAGWRSSSAQ